MDHTSLKLDIHLVIAYLKHVQTTFLLSFTVVTIVAINSGIPKWCEKNDGQTPPLPSSEISSSHDVERYVPEYSYTF